MSTFTDLWPTLPIPGEYDAMDPLDQERWRAVVEPAYIAGATMAYKASRDAAAARLDKLLAAERERCAQLFDVPAGINGEAEDWARAAAARIRGALS